MAVRSPGTAGVPNRHHLATIRGAMHTAVATAAALVAGSTDTTDNTAGTITFAVTILVVVTLGALLALRARRNR